ncbi:MAG: aldo/keto reductase [Chloroflexi bacterium]|nr:aldo/keto reductase [Chloroflexota bacterium]
MRYTRLGRTGLTVSLIGFGGIPVRRLDRAEGVRVVRRALDLGITFYDTARRYGDSEEKMGEALAGHRQQLVLASKSQRLTKEEVTAELEESLRALRTDYIDLYQLHNVSEAGRYETVMGPGGAFEALAEAKRAGKVRFLGITSHKRELGLRGIETGLFDSVMLPFSHLEPEVAAGVLPRCRELDVAFICMKPFSGGILTTAEQCLKWVLQQGVTVAIPGIGSLAELEQDASVGDANWTLAPGDLAAMEAERAEAGKTFCRRCDYCRPCSNDIPISEVLHSTSLLRRQGPSYMGNGQYERVKGFVESCSQCRECEPRCPYGLAIPELLRERLDEIQLTLRAAGWQV